MHFLKRLKHHFKCKPWLAVDILLYKREKDDMKFLAVRRAYEPYKHYYVLPGGFVECGESVEEAASRELKEETGIDLLFEKNDQFRVYSHPKRDPRHHVVTVVFAKEVKNFKSFTFKKDEKEVESLAILSIKKKKEVLGFDHEFILRDFYSSFNA